MTKTRSGVSTSPQKSMSTSASTSTSAAATVVSTLQSGASLPVFSGKAKEYRLWRRRFKAYAASKNVDLSTAGLAEMAEDAQDTNDQAEAKRKTRFTLVNLLTQALDDDNLTEFTEEEDGRRLWTQIEAKYWQRDVTRISQLRGKLDAIKLNNPRDVGSFLTRFKSLIADLQCSGHAVDPSDHMRWLINALPDSMIAVKQQLAIDMSASRLAPDEAYERIRVAAEVSHGRNDTRKSGKSSSSGGDGGSKSNGNGKFKGNCNNCGKKGHKSAECWSKGGGAHDSSKDKKKKRDSNAVSLLAAMTSSDGLITLGEHEHYVDGGAARHILRSADHIRDYEALDGVHVRGMGKASIRGKGHVIETVTLSATPRARASTTDHPTTGRRSDSKDHQAGSSAAHGQHSGNASRGASHAASMARAPEGRQPTHRAAARGRTRWPGTAPRGITPRQQVHPLWC
eukprot:TRINITY_DN9107_c0_g1_i1.p1 TRINITY_DN9107_c0_g1~~TRINITY_DN9107_c0_g1_i1.p1  ORF type:complete len:454 (+),score=55.00 TRINITY_DN9107_c0_g1_i1:1154-2515(+)